MSKDLYREDKQLKTRLTAMEQQAADKESQIQQIVQAVFTGIAFHALLQKDSDASPHEMLEDAVSLEQIAAQQVKLPS